MSTENFYFEDFTGDYYLSKDEAGISHLKVSQKMTAVFPEYRQNKGICLEIPFTNQNGNNVTMPKMTRSDIGVLRNGVVEPIYSIEKYKDYYEVCTGTEEYVLGRQEYTFQYEYEKVVTDFKEYQELYWDTNGNGWRQKFESVTARLHFVGATADDFTGEAWCYVGRYGESGQERCKISKIEDGVEFQAKNLKSYENLTFDAELKAGSFSVPVPAVNYGLVVIVFLMAGVCGAILISAIKKYLAAKPKRDFYRNLFVKPEYQPDPNYDLAEMAEVYIGKKKDFKVGMILDLVVRKKVEILRESGRKWALKVVDLNGVSTEERKLLEILNGGEEVQAGEAIKVKTYSANNKLVGLNNSLNSGVVAELKADGLVEKKYSFRGMAGMSIKPKIIFGTIFGTIFGFMLMMTVTAFLMEVFQIEDFVGEVVLYDELFMIIFMLALVTAATCSTLNAKREVYDKHTEKGLKASRYMDGLKLYIKMAETERLKFLQSVETADVSKEGIVKLYEKLLPYAAVFGLEKSWMEELHRYCKVEEVREPDYMGVATAAELSRMARVSAATAVRSTTFSNDGSGISGGGGSSSGFSGGGGGGFSGGGGGGGGGHGR